DLEVRVDVTGPGSDYDRFEWYGTFRKRLDGADDIAGSDTEQFHAAGDEHVYRFLEVARLPVEVDHGGQALRLEALDEHARTADRERSRVRHAGGDAVRRQALHLEAHDAGRLRLRGITDGGEPPDE